jgi:hypothetical protein
MTISQFFIVSPFFDPMIVGMVDKPGQRKALLDGRKPNRCLATSKWAGRIGDSGDSGDGGDGGDSGDKGDGGNGGNKRNAG